jgi:hypothetical protein
MAYSDRFTEEELAQLLKDNPNLKVFKSGSVTELVDLQSRSITTYVKGTSKQKDKGIVLPASLTLPESQEKGSSSDSKHRQHPEDEFTKQVIELFQISDWLVAHFRPARTSSGNWITAVQGDGKGFPDLVAVKGNRVIFAELKSAKGKVREEQWRWIRRLADSKRVEVYIWHPEDWEKIVEILK